MTEAGAMGSPRDFYWTVTREFHNLEASKYDLRHATMHNDLSTIYSTLLELLPESPTKLEVCDMGCGTGFVGGLLNDLVPHRIKQLTLVDPSARMLDAACEKAVSWAFPTQHILLDRNSVRGGYHIIVANSVLHHIVELAQFCQRVQDSLLPGGIFITAEDPRAEATGDDILRKRRDSLNHWHQRLKPARVVRSVMSKVRKAAGGDVDELEDSLNRTLMTSGVIRHPLSMVTVWAITDFRVPNQPFSIGQGITLQELSTHMPMMELLTYRTYQFFGSKVSRLNRKEFELEHKLRAADDQHGELFASVWRHL
jgi:SAM-dependent methyltransferase